MSQLLTLADWRAAYAAGATPRELLKPVLDDGDPAWILRCDAAFIDAQIERLQDLTPADLPLLPLYGVPFAVKDNIDVAGLPTTAACPAFSHIAEQTATVVQRLMAAGAVLIGKTNLDQFATGLVGTRSPYGEVPNTFDAAYVSGGSSSGSASVVARGLVAFALGTDTAGSGRVPAGLNNLVGLKPTPGSVPMMGVLPACRSLDVVSVFALTVADAAQVMAVMEGAGDEPVFQHHALRPAWFNAGALRVGVPKLPGCDETLGYAAAFDEAIAQLKSWGITPVEINMQPLFDVARLLYDGPWVAERLAVVQALMENDPMAVDGTVRQVIEAAYRYDAVAAFRAQYELETLRAQIAPLWQSIDVLMLPTTPTCPTLAAVAAAPIPRNSELGRFTNFVNLLGQAALAVPSSFSAGGLPFGVTFVAPGGSDAALVDLGLRWEAARALPLGRRLRAATPADLLPQAMPISAPTMEIAVVGAHLAGMPLHGQMTERGCKLLARTQTAKNYRLFVLPGTLPPKPGLVRVTEIDNSGGAAIEVEVYAMPAAAVGSFLALIPPPLGLGSVQLADGRWVKGFICEPSAIAGATDITAHGGWRNDRASQ